MKRFFRRGAAVLLLSIFPFALSACGKDAAKDTRPTEGVGVATVSAVGDIYLTDEML